MDTQRTVWTRAQQRERFVLFDVGPGISTDFLDAGRGAENHGNAAGTDSGSIRGGGSGCAGNGYESGDGGVGQDYDHVGGNVFVSELDSGRVQSRSRSQGIQEFLENGGQCPREPR